MHFYFQFGDFILHLEIQTVTKKKNKKKVLPTLVFFGFSIQGIPINQVLYY